MESSQLDLNDFCRLCLAEVGDDNSFKIFTEGLLNKIILATSLDILPNDTLPKNICKDCRYQLERSHYFRQLSKSCDLRLKKHIRLINQKKRSEILSKNYKDDDIEDLEETYQESYKYFESAKFEIDSLKKHFETEKEEIIKVEVEKAVKKLQVSKFSKKSNQEKSQTLITNKPPIVLNKLAPSNQHHTFTSSPVVRRRKEEEKPEQIEDEIVLGDYEIQFLDKDGKVVDESQHVYQMEESGREIEIIGESQLMEVEEEEEEQADSDEEYKPLTIRKTKKFKVYETKPAKKKEKLSKSSEVSIIVPQTVTINQDDNYFIPVKADGDLDVNGEKKIFQCSFENCRERFARRQACKTHFYNHITTKIVSNGFTCKYCQKYFKVASSLQRHERIHTGLKPFKCDFEGCEKSFSQKEMLKRHNAIHLSLKDAPFPCHLCDKKFRQKEPLRWHINKEHAEDSEVKVSSFMCSICNKPFAHSSGLSRHFLIHSGKTFSCETCGKSFNDKSALKRHGNVHNK